MQEITVKGILKKTTYRSIDVEAVLSKDTPTWIKFDPELGYIPASIVMRDGMDHSNTTYTYEPGGYRKLVNYPDRPCRITTYGNSYTQCQQVSDGETWQEQLAAHIGEPVRSFGNGGIGVYQSCMRMKREEVKDHGGKYVILNVFIDDHIRNLDATRWVRTAFSEKERPADKVYPLHGLPWCHLRYDLDKNTFIEKPAICKNDDDLRSLCDPEHFYNTFKDDIIVKLFTLQQEGAKVEGLDELYVLAKAFNLDVDLENPETRISDAMKLHQLYGQHSSIWLIDHIREWLEQRGKKIFIILSYCMGTMAEYLKSGTRFDELFVDYIKNSGLPWVDLAQKHKDDYADFNISIEDYQKRFYILAKEAAVFGHYSPTGNHFTTYAIKNEIVDWLNPKPQAYTD